MHKAALERIGRDLGDLLARHERGRDLSEFGRYAEDPVGFIREVLHGEPWSRQVEITEAVKGSPLVVVRSAQAVGKDWVAARLALWWVYARGGLVLLTGPTERQVREVVMGEVARAFGRAKDLPGEMFQMALRLGREEKAGIIAFTSTEASKLTGFHAPLVMALLTEAQGCEGFAWEGLLACATGAEDRILAIGNPWHPRASSTPSAGRGAAGRPSVSRPTSTRTSEKERPFSPAARAPSSPSGSRASTGGSRASTWPVC